MIPRGKCKPPPFLSHLLSSSFSSAGYLHYRPFPRFTSPPSRCCFPQTYSLAVDVAPSPRNDSSRRVSNACRFSARRSRGRCTIKINVLRSRMPFTCAPHFSNRSSHVNEPRKRCNFIFRAPRRRRELIEPAEPRISPPIIY